MNTGILLCHGKELHMDIFVSGLPDVLTRKLFQLARYHLDLALVSDTVGRLKNNLIDTLGAEKVTNKCK